MWTLRHLAWLDASELFDNTWFAVSLAEAAAMDPQQRLLLEVGYDAIAACEGLLPLLLRRPSEVANEALAAYGPLPSLLRRPSFDAQTANLRAERSVDGRGARRGCDLGIFLGMSNVDFAHK